MGGQNSSVGYSIHYFSFQPQGHTVPGDKNVSDQPDTPEKNLPRQLLFSTELVRKEPLSPR